MNNPNVAAWRTPVVVLVAGCLIAIIGFGTRSVFGLFLEPMTVAKGWDRETFALAMALQNLLWGIGLPIAGAIADKYGASKIMAIGALIYAAGIWGMSATSSPMGLHLFAGIMTGVGVAFTAFSLAMAAMVRTIVILKVQTSGFQMYSVAWNGRVLAVQQCPTVAHERLSSMADKLAGQLPTWRPAQGLLPLPAGEKVQRFEQHMHGALGTDVLVHGRPSHLHRYSAVQGRLASSTRVSGHQKGGFKVCQSSGFGREPACASGVCESSFLNLIHWNLCCTAMDRSRPTAVVEGMPDSVSTMPGSERLTDVGHQTSRSQISTLPGHFRHLAGREKLTGLMWINRGPRACGSVKLGENHLGKPMKIRRAIFASVCGSLVLGAVLAYPVIATADDGERSQVWSIARGGQLYDKWWAVLGHEKPKQTHSAYPSEGKKSGNTTWRCKECHGWDYRGVDGAYSKGSHYSGVKGIRSYVGKDPTAISTVLRGDLHGYSEDLIPDKELNNLALFVSLGQVDMDLYIDRSTGKSRGDAKRGARTFQTVCAVCHGFDGKQINFKDADKPEYVGTVAHKNPWEFLHKARFGQPGVPMIALITLPVDDLIDLLAYSQTLPTK